MTGYERARAEINLANIRDNLINLKKLAAPKAKALAVIKADGYGHGANEIADYIDDITDAYAVAMIDEAMGLREHGVTKTILILGYTPDEYLHYVVDNNISQTVYDYETAVKLSEIAVSHNTTALIHIKLDTGMGRLGFQCDRTGIEDIVRISELDNIRLEGCFTHFSKADETDLDYTRKQFDRYMAMVNELEGLGIKFDIRHVCNSAAAMQFPEASLDMVRYGIALYGLYPSDEVDKSVVQLKPAMSIKSAVSHVKELEPGRLISYGGTYETTKRTVVATIPFGYADGYPRARSNTGKVIINGHYAPIIGRVCMDQFMVDVTDIPDVKKTTPVTIMGSDGGLNISAEEIAADACSFNYELVCGINKRVPRKYIVGKPDM